MNEEQQILNSNISSILEKVAYIIITVVGTTLWLRRKISRDGVEIIKDRAEGDLIKDLTAERDTLAASRDHLINRITEVEKERNEALLDVRSLTMEVQHLTEKVQELKKIVEDAMHKLEQATHELQEYAVKYTVLIEKYKSISGNE